MFEEKSHYNDHYVFQILVALQSIMAYLFIQRCWARGVYFKSLSVFFDLGITSSICSAKIKRIPLKFKVL